SWRRCPFLGELVSYNCSLALLSSAQQGAGLWQRRPTKRTQSRSSAWRGAFLGRELHQLWAELQGGGRRASAPPRRSSSPLARLPAPGKSQEPAEAPPPQLGDEPIPLEDDLPPDQDAAHHPVGALDHPHLPLKACVPVLDGVAKAGLESLGIDHRD